MNSIASEESRPVDELVSFTAPGSLEADQYRVLRHAVERLRQDQDYHVFGITSAAAGDGKSVTTLNLAGSLAQSSGARVLVICADLHRETVPQYLGLKGTRTPGLADALANENLSLADVVHRLERFNLSIVPAGNVQARPYELLSSRRLQSLLEEARNLHDYVLIDTPPVAPLADCRLLGRWVDGFIFVVAAHKTPRKLLVEALRVFEPGKLLGVVFNGDDQPLSPYYGYYAQHQSSVRGGQ
jgi:capsular exopolysaccharide synthesis family protein